MDGIALLERARAAGLVVRSEGDKLVIRGPRVAEPLALELIAHKQSVLPLVQEPFVPWMLREWRRVTIPQWRRNLRESIEQRNTKQEDYARWMLQDVRMDAEYNNAP